MHLNSELFQIKRLDREDVPIAKKLFQLFRDVFGQESRANPGEAYLKDLLGKPGFIIYAAMYGDEVAGGLTAYELPMWHSESSEMFLYDIAIRPEYQRIGLGKKLLLALMAYCRQAGIREMFVAADEDDTHALDFYHATGGKAAKVVHFTYNTDN